MFSFCLYDMKKDLYFCARDRYGKKPFFYYFKDNKFIFSSSIKSILNLLDYKPNLNKVAVSKYMQYFVSYGEDTFYQNIFKLESSSYMIYEPLKAQELLKKKYYKINTYKAIKDEKQALNSLAEEISKVKYANKGEVPFGKTDQIPIFPKCKDLNDKEQKSCVVNSISNYAIQNFNLKVATCSDNCNVEFDMEDAVQEFDTYIKDTQI